MTSSETDMEVSHVFRLWKVKETKRDFCLSETVRKVQIAVYSECLEPFPRDKISMA